MSRRARKKKGAKKNWLGKGVLVIGVVLVLGSGIGFLVLRSYLHSDGFRGLVSQLVNNALRVNGGFGAFQWDGLAVGTDGYEGKGEEMVSSMKVDRISTEVGFGGIWRGVWEVKATRIGRLEISLDTTKKEEKKEPEVVEVKPEKQGKSWIPSKVELESLEVGEVAFDLKTEDAAVNAKGMRVMVLPESSRDSYKLEVRNGILELPFRLLPPMRVEGIDGKYNDGSLFITRAEVGAWKSGRITTNGEWNFDTKKYAFNGNVDRVKCDEVLNEDWSKRLVGDVSSSFEVTNRSGKDVSSGELELRNGVLTALPVLDSLGAYTDTTRFRVLQLSEARTKWQYSEGELLLTDFVFASEGLIKIQGNLKTYKGKIDGRFMLGLVPGTLATIPGAETHVFTPGPNGLLWAPIRITGTLDDPQEDLTNRLIEAAGLRMFEIIPDTGEKVLKFTRNALVETPGKVIDGGKVIIEGGGQLIEKGTEAGKEVIKETEDIFRGLLGD